MVYGNDAIGSDSWFRKFTAGNFNLEDGERCRRQVFFNHGYDLKQYNSYKRTPPITLNIYI